MNTALSNNFRAPAPVPGPPGEVGAAGPQGLKGDTGAVGPQGLKGDTGAVGPQGLKGDTGGVGPVGPAGDDGMPGGPGPQGLPGETGLQGPPGEQGDQGNDGAVGPPGPGVDNLTVSLSRRALNDSGILFGPHQISSDGSSLSLYWDVIGSYVRYAVISSSNLFYGSDSVLTFLLLFNSVSAGPSTPEGSFIYKPVRNSVLETIYPTAGGISVARINMSAGSGATSPVYEFLISRTLTHIVCSARTFS